MTKTTGLESTQNVLMGDTCGISRRYDRNCNKAEAPTTHQPLVTEWN